MALVPCDKGLIHTIIGAKLDIQVHVGTFKKKKKKRTSEEVKKFNLEGIFHLKKKKNI